MVAGKQPIEDGSPGGADVEVTSGARGDTNANSHKHRELKTAFPMLARFGSCLGVLVSLGFHHEGTKDTKGHEGLGGRAVALVPATTEEDQENDGTLDDAGQGRFELEGKGELQAANVEGAKEKGDR